ncbi:MAG: hypothetical protein CL470_02480 [Acidimicrobiaceae bacterium]|nr:hypothetical protein [Acidimicrobiaceae bacterium]|tara:strand:- start:1179 stop:1358 length:180 start_codon:yes stop_codon:yes gene_type:complete
MTGTVIIIILLVAVVPVAIIMSGFFASALLGHLLKKDVDSCHEGSELLEISQKDFTSNS